MIEGLGELDNVEATTNWAITRSGGGNEKDYNKL